MTTFTRHISWPILTYIFVWCYYSFWCYWCWITNSYFLSLSRISFWPLFIASNWGKSSNQDIELSASNDQHYHHSFWFQHHFFKYTFIQWHEGSNTRQGAILNSSQQIICPISTSADFQIVSLIVYLKRKEMSVLWTFVVCNLAFIVRKIFAGSSLNIQNYMSPPSPLER